MGSTSWSATDYAAHTSSIASKTIHDVFKSSALPDELNPLKFGVRESRDSATHPNSTPIIIGVDVTGSMGKLADQIVRSGLGTIMDDIYEHKPITGPHILCLAIGDAEVDSAPIQATQFESDAILAKQIEKFYLEKGGGGNSGESYHLAWYFAAFRTSCDSMIKRKKKGYLFTIGDEAPLNRLSKASIKKFFGEESEIDYTSEELFELASKNWEIFHVVIKPVSGQDVMGRWSDLIGQRLIRVDNFDSLPEVIASAIRVVEGEAVDSVAKSWSGAKEIVVRDALTNLAKRGDASGAVINL